MSVEFFKAKNGDDCAKANGIFLHSQYNPQTESERFAQNVAVNFIPQTIIVIEGALSYCVGELRKKFPNAKIGTIRLCADFNATNHLWDFVLNTDGCGGFQKSQSFGGATVISEQLYNLLGEEGIFKTLFLEWQPSARAFAQETKNAWLEIKTAIEKSKAVLLTREYFERKWLKNKIKFFSRINSDALLKKISTPVFICASGPSLAAAIPIIKNIRQKVFVCALSSALNVLLHNNIVPDLCFSTDGGYWATKHLDILNVGQKNIKQIDTNNTPATVRGVPPLALSTEGECASIILQNTTIIPLCYEDDILSKKLFAALDLFFMKARRNGTVSGTALEFFLALTEHDIFFAGLDLSPGITFSHTQPNALEINAAQTDFRLAPKATRIARTTLHSPSLDLYAQWFANYSWSGKQKVYRIRGEEKFKNNLGKIEDIEASVAEEKILKRKCHACKRCDSVHLTNQAKQHADLKFILSDFSATQEFTSEIFPTDSILANRAATTEERQKYENIISQKTQKLLQDIFRKLK